MSIKQMQLTDETRLCWTCSESSTPTISFQGTCCCILLVLCAREALTDICKHVEMDSTDYTQQPEDSL
jgi:hypothetical protein